MAFEHLFRHGDLRGELRRLEQRSVNFDVSRRAEYTADNGWHIDAYCRALPAEPPGDPVSDGPFSVACRLLHDYEFTDPDLVRGVYDADGPLADRTMLLEIRWLVLRFQVGVRVGERFDERREVAGRPVHVWGWNYRTLEGHFEMGQMDYAIWKWLDTGQVEFRIHAYSRAARDVNPVVRLGFRLVGRRQQKRFARSALERMEALVRAELSRAPDAGPVPAAREGLTVTPAEDLDRLERKIGQGAAGSR